MKIVRQSAYIPVPWKNGGGTTLEALRVPEREAHDGAFRWRVSVAHIAASGPFSEFAGYQRKMALLRGDGVRLTFPGAHHTELRTVGDLVEFDGALPPHCELLGGACVDLNLMTSDSLRSPAVEVEKIAAPREFPVAQDATTLIFCMTGPMTIGSLPDEVTVLDTWDLAVVSPGTDGVIRLAPGDASVPALVFMALIEDLWLPN